MVEGEHPCKPALRRAHAKVMSTIPILLQQAQRSEVALMPPACSTAQAERHHHMLGRAIAQELLFSMILETVRTEGVPAGRAALDQLNAASEDFERRLNTLATPGIKLVTDEEAPCPSTEPSPEGE